MISRSHWSSFLSTRDINLYGNFQNYNELMSDRPGHRPFLLYFDLFVNTLRLRQNGRHFPDNIFKCIFLNENVWILIKVSLKFVPKGQINNIPAVVQIMAWRRSGAKPLSEPMMASLPTRICITRPQWVKNLGYPNYIQQLCTQSMPCYVLLHLSIDWFYPYLLGLLHLHWGNHMIAPVSTKQPWMIRVNILYEPHCDRIWYCDMI